MTEIRAKAYAKINLSLDILGRRDDGYHELSMVMQTIDLCDDILIQLGTGKLDRVSTNLSYLPDDARNLALAAARGYFAEINRDPGGIYIQVEKRIPVSAGMGGGSADAAAVLRGLLSHLDPLDGEDVMKIAAALGSDVPFCLRGGTAIARGVGDELEELPNLPDCKILVCKPNFPLSTKKMFEMIDGRKIRQRPHTEGLADAIRKGDVSLAARHMFNVFEPFVAGRHKELSFISETMLDGGALGAAMSGSGPTMFGIFDDEIAAKKTLEALSGRSFFTALCSPAGSFAF